MFPVAALRRVIAHWRGRRVLPFVGLAVIALAGPVLLASAHPITVDGLSTDWLSRAPLYDNTGIVARDAAETGEYVWADHPGDERTAFASPDPRVDMTEVRFTATSTSLNALVKLASLPVASGNGAPQIQIAIDTNGVSGSGEANLVRGADTQVADVAQWEYLLQTKFGSGTSNLNVWQAGNGTPTVTGATGQGADGTIEISVPWSQLGFSGPPSTALRFTVATFRSTAGDQTQDVGGPSVSNALDVVTDYGDPATSGYPNTAAEFASDQTINYFSQVYFNAAGDVRAPAVVSRFATDLGATPAAEWIQVANTTGAPLNISGYKVGDEKTPDGGEGMDQFPSGTTLPAGGSVRVARSATAYFSVYGTNPDYELTSTDPSVPDLIPFPNWGSAVPDFADSGDEIMLLDSSPNTQIDIVTYGSGSYTGVVARSAPGPSEFVSRATSLRDTDNNSSDFSLSNCAGTIVFDGGPSGNGTSWHLAANWDDTTTHTDRLPTATDHVCIPDLPIAGVTFDTGTTSVLSINSEETLNVNGGSLNITSTLQPSEIATLNLSNGEFAGAGSLTITNLFHWTGGQLNGPNTTATTTIPAGSRWQLDGASSKHLFARTLTNNSTTPVNWTGGNLYLSSGGLLVNGVGATINLNGDQDLSWYAGAEPTFNNAGTFAKTGGSADGYIDTTVNNSGTMAANSGFCSSTATAPRPVRSRSRAEQRSSSARTGRSTSRARRRSREPPARRCALRSRERRP